MEKEILVDGSERSVHPSIVQHTRCVQYGQELFHCGDSQAVGYGVHCFVVIHVSVKVNNTHPLVTIHAKDVPDAPLNQDDVASILTISK